MNKDSSISSKKFKNQTDEIDLIALAKTLWEGRREVIVTTVVFMLIGLFVAIFSQKEYTATTTMVPQLNSPASKMGGLSSLASLAGFNLDMGTGGGELSPTLYPQIVSSISFQLEIMNATYRFEELEEEVTLFDYYMDYYKPGIFSIIKKYTIGLPGVILSTIRNDDSQEAATQIDSGVISISKDQEKIRKVLEEKLSLAVNDKEGFLTLSSNFHQAALSAQIATKALVLLQEYITKYKIEKASAQLAFIEERYSETKKEFESAQIKLANFRDKNKNITSALAQTELEKLQNEYQLAFEVYSELAKQLEQARIKVKEDTPVFLVIEEVSVPIEKSKPKRSLILLIWIFLGGVLGIGLVFFKSLIRESKKRWSEVSQV